MVTKLGGFRDIYRPRSPTDRRSRVPLDCFRLGPAIPRQLEGKVNLFRETQSSNGHTHRCGTNFPIGCTITAFRTNRRKPSTMSSEVLHAAGSVVSEISSKIIGTEISSMIILNKASSKIIVSCFDRTVIRHGHLLFYSREADAWKIYLRLIHHAIRCEVVRRPKRAFDFFDVFFKGMVHAYICHEKLEKCCAKYARKSSNLSKDFSFFHTA